MRKLFIFIVVLITIVWFFYSYNFYTCNIKGFCNEDRKIENNINNKKGSGIINNKGIKEEKEKVIKDGKSATGMIQEEEKIEKIEEDDKVKKEVNKKIDCKDIITQPIKYGSKSNNSIEVKTLEKFLNETQGSNLEVNGIYDKNDYDEVKKFQLKYRKDILDPWGIKIPTGYVYNTTIKKINEIYCLNKK